MLLRCPINKSEILSARAIIIATIRDNINNCDSHKVVKGIGSLAIPILCIYLKIRMYQNTQMFKLWTLYIQERKEMSGNVQLILKSVHPSVL